MRHGEYTVGVEEEYQLVDPGSGELRGRAPELVEAGAGKREFQRTMIEVSTEICRSPREAVAELMDLRRRLAAEAATRGLHLASSGMHPVGPYPPAQVTDEGHYRRVAEQGATPTREMHVFGLHVHVGVPSHEAAIHAMYGAALHIPELLLLTASSPFHRARDTGYASYRTVIRDMSPRVGVPIPLSSAEEYDRLELLLAGAPEKLAEKRPISWDIRPSRVFPTLEFRLFDANPWPDAIELAVALARALTAAFAEGPRPLWGGVEYQLLRENRWRAARFGGAARFYRLGPAQGESRPAHDAVRELVDLVGPVAEELGDGASLALVDRVLERGTAAEAMREVYARESSFPAVVDWLVGETRVW